MIFAKASQFLAKNVVYWFFHSVQHYASHDFYLEQIKGDTSPSCTVRNISLLTNKQMPMTEWKTISKCVIIISLSELIIGLKFTYLNEINNSCSVH